jgi:hypothetical protein
LPNGPWFVPRFTVPAGLAHGRYDLRVVANGIASREVEVRAS